MGAKSVEDMIEASSGVHFSGFHMNGLELRNTQVGQPTTLAAEEMHKQPFVIGELVSVHFVDFVLVLFWYRFSVNSLIGLYRVVLCGSLLVLWDQSLVMCWLTSNGRWNSGCMVGICNDQEKSFHQNEFLNFSLLPRFGMSMEIVRREQIRESSWIIAFIYYQLKNMFYAWVHANCLMYILIMPYRSFFILVWLNIALVIYLLLLETSN